MSNMPSARGEQPSAAAVAADRAALVGQQAVGLGQAFWRALWSCLHPQVIWAVSWPMAVSVLVFCGLAVWGWAPWVRALEGLLAGQEGQAFQGLLTWLGLPPVDAQGVAHVLAPLLLTLLAVPVLVLAALLTVSAFLVPTLSRWVVRKQGLVLAPRAPAPWWRTLWRSAVITLKALAVLALSFPLWWVPVLGTLVPALVWGWLASRALSDEVLADHADDTEAQALRQAHGTPLLLLGLLATTLGAAPSHLLVIGAVTAGLVAGLAGGAWLGPAGALFAVGAPVLVGLFVWFYILLFAFSALCFAHYLLPRLAALQHASLPIRA